MPTDKPSGFATKKPVTPALSSRFRNTKPPIAPRLAGSVSYSPGVAARKDTRKGTTPAGDDSANTPPVDNVTPRSSARLSRASTDSPSTPSYPRRPSITNPALNSPSAVGIVNVRSAGSSTNAVQARTTRRISGSSTTTTKDEGSSKFFYAGDVRSTHATPRAMLPVTKSVVMNAIRNAEHVKTSRMATPGVTERQSTSPDNDKFIRANDLTPNQTPRARPVLPKQSSSTSASSFRTRSPVMSRQNSAVSPRMSPQRSVNAASSRPGSPVKTFVASPLTATSPTSPADRRNSIGGSSAVSRFGAVGGHKKSASVSTATRSNVLASPTLSRLQLVDHSSTPNIALEPQAMFPSMMASPDSMSPRSASLNSSKTVGTSTTSDTELSDIAKIILAVKESQTDSVKDVAPIPPKPSPLSQAQVEAANARRERKVLDLEISNSSLLAINKTLERELRKQSAEIRRFRRLSRSGRLSFAPSNRSVSAQSMLSALSEQAEDDEEEFDSSDMNDDDESDVSNGKDENLSDTDSITARSRRRAREERRLMLDLSKHQQLLIDSQKLSQSIRKCVDLTEELIKDGKRALDYKVGIGDVRLGGRVLSSDVYDAEAEIHGLPDHTSEPRRGLLSPSLTQTELQEAAGMWFGGMPVFDGQSIQQQSEPGLLESFDKLKLVQTEPG